MMNRIAKAVISVVSLLSMIGVAFGQPSVPVMKLLPSDGAPGEEFGVSIEISGSIAMIGALSGSDDDGVPIGSVYFFDLNTGAEINELLPDDGAALDGFGFHTDWDGKTALIAAASNDEAGYQSGAVYLYDTSTWEQLAKVTSPNPMPRDFFGSDVAIAGNNILVGSIYGDGPDEESGIAYLFNAESGELLHQLAPDGLTYRDGFGTSVALNDTHAAVSAPRIQHSGFRYGSVFVFDLVTGNLAYQLTAAIGEGFSRFGNQIEIKGEYLIVASPFDSENGVDAGAVFIFDLASGDLVQKVLENTPGLESFGVSIDCEGRYLVSSAIANQNEALCDCRIVLFDLLTGDQVLVIRHPPSDPHELFGFPLRLSGTTLLAGAVRDDDNGVDAGAVYVFDLSTCFADLNRDGVADVADLSALIDGFGGADLALDINGDGAVDAADLGLMIRSFGGRCE